MDQKQLTQLVALSHAFWPDASMRARVTAETVSAVSVLGLETGRQLERSASLLFHRSERDGPGAIAEAAVRPYYRLLASERFILLALHRSRWSYSRIGRVLGIDPGEVEATAWAARLHLISQPGRTMYLPHPTGSRISGERCPEYDVRRPWTQRFMDEELEGRERAFLQSHSLACEPCRTALSRARAVYFAAEAELPRWTDLDDQCVRELCSLLRATHAFRRPADRTFLESVRLYLRRPEARLSVLVVVATSIWLFTRALAVFG